jgi:uncharacterized repeat protein (TIGR03803 family)
MVREDDTRIGAQERLMEFGRRTALVLLVFWVLVRPMVLPAQPLVPGTLAAGASRVSKHSIMAPSPPPSERVIYTFKSFDDAATPQAPLIADASGSLYGTSASGGGVYSCDGQTCGTVFKLTKSRGGYSESILYRFLGGSDGAFPLGGLLADASGALYGTTSIGGSANFGTVFKLTPTDQDTRNASSIVSKAVATGGFLRRPWWQINTAPSLERRFSVEAPLRVRRVVERYSS